MIDAQLAVRVRDVTLDGGEADHQVIGDFLVPHTGGNETQDVEFACRERLGEASKGDLGGAEAG